MNYIFIMIGFLLLIKCADFFVEGCSKIAKVFGIPSLIIGLTIVAFGTSAPETSVSTIASLSGKNTISVGNVVGSNICNLLLVLGVSSLFGKLTVKKEILKRDYSYSLLAYLVLFLMMGFYFFSGKRLGELNGVSGIILLSFMLMYLIILFMGSKNQLHEKEKETFKIKYIMYIIVGLIGIIYGGELVVVYATRIASSLGVSDNVIALTIVAVGTSLPELFTSVMAAKKNETDIAIGNVIGSNIYNIFFILGISSIVGHIIISFESFIDIIFMVISGIVTLFIIGKNKEITKSKGVLMLFLYFLYIGYILIR